MAKNSSYYVSSPSPFGQMATGFGKGLAESVPEELKYQRLKSGLSDLAENSANLTPEQYYAKAASVYGVTPQMLQDFQKMAKLQSARNRYGQPASGQEVGGQQNSLSAIQDQGQSTSPIVIQQATPEQAQSKGLKSDVEQKGQSRQEKRGMLPIENPLLSKFQPVRPPTVQELEAGTGREMALDPYISPEEARERYLAKRALGQKQPEFEREKQGLAVGAREDLKKEIDNRLTTLLQRPDIKETFGDFTGKAYLNLIDKANEIMANNPGKNIYDVAQDMQEGVEKFVRSKGRLREMANRDFVDKIFPQKKEDVRKSIQEIQKTFSDIGQEKELFDILRSENTENSFGFGLSPGSSAILSYPISKEVSKSIRNREVNLKKAELVGKKVLENINPSDSLLAIIRDLKESNPLVNESELFQYFRDNRKSLYPRQQEELEYKPSDVAPNWGDIFLMPAFGRSI